MSHFLNCIWSIQLTHECLRWERTLRTKSIRIIKEINGEGQRKRIRVIHMNLLSSIGNILATFKYYLIQEKKITMINASTINSKLVSFLYLLLFPGQVCSHVEPDGLLGWLCVTAARMLTGCTYSYKCIT